ncbi:protein penguin [Achroia grisella]|uniref:protein penguin n=1 Tax=Achroia grisella TaxID=688607 RepID=UPI0027D22FFC|nr:protein penguin [Achroia grisella]
MQKVKRKSSESDPIIVQKKAKNLKSENGPNSQNKIKPKLIKKNGSKDGNKQENLEKSTKKFNQQKKIKGKPNFIKDKHSKAQSNGEKPKWSEMKKEKKQLRIVRRKAKTTAEVFEISHKAKLLSAQIQRKVVKSDFRENSCKELHCLMKGQYKSIALTHDLSRVIQVLLKYSPEDIKTEVTEELLDIIVPMVQSKYGQHAVKRIVKYGTEFIRHEVIKKFFGHIVSLAAHSISAPVLDYAYGEFATKKEKIYMQQEFYGEIYKNSKDDKVKTLSDAYKGSPEMKIAILQSCKANIQRILDKNLHDNELLHSVLYDYIRECNAEERVELITTLSPLIVPLSNSLPGVNAASICVWQGTNKDKKTILKVVKEHALSLSKHKTGYRLLLAIFDSVDDTVLVKKAIVSTLANNLKDIAKDHWGVMTLHWLIKPKDSAIFHPSLIKLLEDGSSSGTSKKDGDLRTSELREAILPVLKQDIESDPEFWVSNKTIMLLTVAILSIECTKEMLNSLSKAICRPDWHTDVNGKQLLAIEDAGIHMCLKKLASLDKDKNDCTLGEAIVDNLNQDNVTAWLATNRGCFFILKLIESNNDIIASKLVNKIKSHRNILKENVSGAKLLIQKLNK